jgi:hypothetical protein
MNNLKLYSVNWQDGMLLSERHLKDQERYLEDLSRWYAIPSGDQYGLVRKGHGVPAALSLNMAVRGNQLEVEVIHCQAVTSDGYYVDIDQSYPNPVKASMALVDGEVPVYLVVKPNARVATGTADPTEDVPRLPYLAAGYDLFLEDRPNAPAGEILPIAKLMVDGTVVSHAPNYMPPCVSVYADERLYQKMSDLRNRLETLLSIGNRAYASILSGEKTELQVGLTNAIYNFVWYLSSTLDEFTVGPNAGHPMGVVLFFKKMFRVFHTLLNLHPGVRDFVHEKYFVKVAGTDVSRFMSSIDDYLMARYNHENIGGHLVAIEGILEQIKGLMSSLAQVKTDQLGPQAVATDSLSYLGRTYMVVPYTNTRIEQVGELIYLEVQIAKTRPMNDTVILLAKSLFSVQDWTNMKVKLGLNEARGLGETDPVAVDATTYGDKVALHPYDMLQSQSVRKLTMIFRGVPDAKTFSRLGKMDLFVYAQ